MTLPIAKTRPLTVAGLLGTGIALGTFVFGLTAHLVHAAVPTTGDVYVGLDSGMVNHYTNAGGYVETLHSTHTRTTSTGMCFDPSGNLYSTQMNANTVSRFNPNGSLFAANFGSGYNQNPESCVINTAGQILVGQTGGTHQVRKLDGLGNLLATYNPAVGPEGTNWIDLGGDQCTLYYTSGGTLIRRFNVCTNTQMSDFATAPSGPCYAHRVRPNGELLVTCSTAIYRFDPSGHLLGLPYLGALLQPSTGQLVSLNLDPDNTSFWTADAPSQVFQVDIADGHQINTFSIPSIVGGLAVVGEPQQTPSPRPPSTPTSTPSLLLPQPPVTGRICRAPA